MTTINKREVHKFLDEHPNILFSAAKFEYSLYLESETVEIDEKTTIGWKQEQIKKMFSKR